MSRSVKVWILTLLLGTFATASRAQPASDDFWTRWFERSDHTKTEQPRWVTPLATTTPRLEQEARYDVVWQRRPDGSRIENYGNSKGLELIPSERIEIIVGIPAYVTHDRNPADNGFADWRMLVKYRLLSRNEQSGNYILTAFLDVSVPTGSLANGAPNAILTPTLAYGKGFGRIDIQGTFAAGLPAGHVETIGRTYTSNNAIQYQLFRRIWPEVEVNTTFFDHGRNDGHQQTFVTPGIVVGRLSLTDRVGLTFGVGVQLAISRFRSATQNTIVSLRIPF